MQDTRHQSRTVTVNAATLRPDALLHTARPAPLGTLSGPIAGRLVLAHRRRMAGVTLVELMIVVVIVAILGVIAVPSYREYTKRTHRTEAKSALLQIQTNQERWYLQNNTYTNDLTNLGFTGGTSENGVYTLEIESANLAQGYTATATPTTSGGSNGVTMTDDDECTEFSINSQGVRAATPDGNGRCW